MQHQIYPDRFNDDGEFVPAVIVEVPDVLYLQVVDTDDCEDWPAPSEPDERTHCDERINSSDVAYVPLFRAERAEALARKLDELAREHGLADGAALIDALNEGRILTVGRRDVHDRITGILDVERALRVRAERAEAEAAHYRAQLSAAEEAALECQREAAALRAQLDAAQEAAHMPDDWPHGLPSWVNQRLYAAYIGAAFSPQVLEQIRTGRLTFPDAPIYAEAAQLRAELDAARATLASAVTVSIGGALHRVLPAPVGYSGDSETVWRVEHGGLVVQQFGLSKAAPGDSREEAG